jgi:hypothetical protein
MIKNQKVIKLLNSKMQLNEFTNEMLKLGIHTVQPDEIVSMVFKRGEKRFFPSLNEEEQVESGYFG